MDTISIVVAAYNAENTINRCVDSLLNQTYSNTEIILVNDCSKDGTLNICEEYATQNDNVLVVNNSYNQGVSETRNNGLRVATGKYICFVDSDDYVEDTYLEHLYRYRTEYRTLPICGFVFHNQYSTPISTKYRWRQEVELVSVGDIFELLDRVYLGALWNKLFDIALIRKNKILFDTELSMGEDLKFTIDYIEVNHITHFLAFSETLYHYVRVSNNSLMSNFGKEKKSSYENNLHRMYCLCKNYNENADLIYTNHLQKTKRSICYNLIQDETLTARKRIDYIRVHVQNYSYCSYIRDRISYRYIRIKTIIKKLIIKR